MHESDGAASRRNVERLAACYSGVLHDVMRADGLTCFTLPPTLRPLLPGSKLAGPVYTVRGRVCTDVSGHETLLAWTGLLSKAPGGHVLVIQPNDSSVAHMGELSAETLMHKGVLGAIVDGGVRDAEFIMRMGFQVWHRYFTPRDVVGCWLPDAFDETVSIADVVIEPGDYVFGDRDGVVRIPKGRLTHILTLAEEAMGRENQVRTAILNGEDPQVAYLKYGKF